MSESRTDPDLQSLVNLDPVIHAQARLMVLTYLYVVENADYVFLMHLTGLTWGNLSTHMSKLEEAGYLEVEKSFRGRRPNTTLRLTPKGREAFYTYAQTMKRVFEDFPY